jgi:catechol 2,3-dioxygenase
MSTAAPSPIAPQTTVGAVHLTVADVECSIAFYTAAVGLRSRERHGSMARLGTSHENLLVLYEQPGARPAHGHAGLFHFALLVPERMDLARWVAHAASARVRLSGMSDHRVSEAVYLADPDGHGIEVYRDRPRSQWPWRGDRVEMATLPLDVEDLLGTLDGDRGAAFAGLPDGTRVGHVHLRVADIADTERFYRDVLGFDVVARYGDEATFLSAGGYHHHVGANVWAGRGVTPPPPGSAALRHATLVLPDDAERRRVAERVATAGAPVEERADDLLVRDPAGNALALVVAVRR